MHPGAQARIRPDHPAFIMASSGENVSYGELERRTNRLAHYLRGAGLGRLDHYAIIMENNARYIECCGAGERAGLYYTCVNSYLTPEELAYILTNSNSRVLITSQAKRETALKAMALAPGVERCLVVDGPGEGANVANLDEALAGLPDTPIADESLGTAMLYSSGTTGRPKGIIRPLPDGPPGEPLPLYDWLDGLWKYRDGMVYLSPAPLYHSAPHVSVNLTLRRGGTAVIMEHFDPEQYLALGHGIGHSPNLECPLDLAAVLRRFIEKTIPARAAKTAA